MPCHANDNYKKKLHAWEMTCGIPPERRGMILLNSIPNKSKFKDGLANKFVDIHSSDQMLGVEGYELLKRFLDKELGEKKIYKMVSRWGTLEDCERSQGESAHAFVDSYVGAYETVKSVCGITIPPQIKAFM